MIAYALFSKRTIRRAIFGRSVSRFALARMRDITAERFSGVNTSVLTKQEGFEKSRLRDASASLRAMHGREDDCLPHMTFQEPNNSHGMPLDSYYPLPV